MIKGLPGLDLNSLASFARVKGGQPPSRDITPVPRMDTVQLSPRGQQLATGSGAERSGSATAYRPVGPSNVAGRAEANSNSPSSPQPPVSAPDTRPAEPASMLDRMRASFLTREGDARFDAEMDLNSDGTIDFKDVGILREQPSPVTPESMFKQMQSAFLSREGDDAYEATVDLNNDGVIDFHDMGMLKAKMDAAETPQPPVAPIPGPAEPVTVSVQTSAAESARIDPEIDLLTTIRRAFLSAEGDSAFSTAADLNSDGQVDFLDLAELRARQELG